MSVTELAWRMPWLQPRPTPEMNSLALKSSLGALWQERLSALVWYIALRYLVIGVEYVFLGPESRKFWHFDEVHAVVLGLWLVIVGSCGVYSRLFSRFSNRATILFSTGILLHSSFRLWTCVQQSALGDPLAVLFLADAVAAFWILKQLPKWKRFSV